MKYADVVQSYELFSRLMHLEAKIISQVGQFRTIAGAEVDSFAPIFLQFAKLALGLREAGAFLIWDM